MNPAIRKSVILIVSFVGIIFAVRYLLPLFAPFLLGAVLAFAAEPMVQFFCSKLHMQRAFAAGIGVSMAFCFLVMVVLFLCGLLVRELRLLSGVLPELETAVRTGMNSAASWLLRMAQKAPDGIRTLLTQNVNAFFSGGSALLDRAMDFLLHLASGLLSRVPGQALSIGTGIISSFMISAKLPTIREFFRSRLPVAKMQHLFDALGRMKRAMVGWLKAQLKLSCVTFLIAGAGLLLLQVRYALLWAALIAVVDAFPILGTGVILIPWSAVSFLQGDPVPAFGLLGIYAAAALTRSVLEPRLVGKQLGLDPLVTLAALYVGYQIFGFWGLLFAPLLTVALMQLVAAK